MWAWAAGILVGLGVTAAVWHALGLLRELARRVERLGRITLAPWRWRHAARLLATWETIRMPPEHVRSLPTTRAILAELVQPRSPLILLPVAATAVMAALSRDPILGGHLIFLGCGMAVYLAYRQVLGHRRRVADDVKDLIEAFVSMYRVMPSTFTALELAAEHVQPGLVRNATLEAVRRYRTTRDPHQALRSLYQVRDPYLRRFAMILDHAGEQGGAEVHRLIQDLSDRLRRRWLTRLAARGAFASVRSTMMVLAGAAVAVIGAVAIVPLWRSVYVDGGRRLMYIVLSTVALAAVAYFDRRMGLDEEALL